MIPDENVVVFPTNTSWVDRHVGLFYFLCAMVGAALGVPIGLYIVNPLLEKLFG